MVVSKQKSKADFARRFNAAMAGSSRVPDDRRQWRGWLAKTYGVSVESARKWLMGEAIPDIARLAVIATDLGSSVDQLLMSDHPPAQALARKLLHANEPVAPPYQRIAAPSQALVDVDVLRHILELMESIKEGTPAERAQVIAAFYDAVVTGGEALNKAAVLKLLRSA